MPGIDDIISINAAKKKKISVIKHCKNPAFSAIGFFVKEPTATQLKKDIPNEIQRNIWLSVFKDLQLRNLHLISAMPMVLAYSKEMATYFILTEAAGDQIMTIRRGDDVLNPLLVQANRCLNNAANIFKLLGLDPLTRGRIADGPPPQDKNKKKGDFDGIL